MCGCRKNVNKKPARSPNNGLALASTANNRVQPQVAQLRNFAPTITTTTNQDRLRILKLKQDAARRKALGHP